MYGDNGIFFFCKYNFATIFLKLEDKSFELDCISEMCVENYIKSIQENSKVDFKCSSYGLWDNAAEKK